MTNENMNQESAFATVLDDTYGAVKTQAIHLAALLGLADLVKDGPKSVAELAQATAMHQSSLYRLLYALASCGYFVEVEPGVFAQSPLSFTLRTDIPHSLHALAIMQGEGWQWQPLQYALRSIQTGKEVFSEIFGKDYWGYLSEDNPEAGRLFAQAMRSVSVQGDLAVARGYDFSSAGTIIDIAGGEGSLLTTILQTYPASHGILFDQAAVIEAARQHPSINELQSRLTLVAGNFFEAIPSGGDIYTVKHIIHDWEDAECIQLLSNCSKVMNVGSRLLVVDEIIVPGKKIPSGVALLDLLLHFILPGRKRSEEEHRALFAAAGLQLTHIYPTESNYVILETVKA